MYTLAGNITPIYYAVRGFVCQHRTCLSHLVRLVSATRHDTNQPLCDAHLGVSRLCQFLSSEINIGRAGALLVVEGPNWPCAQPTRKIRPSLPIERASSPRLPPDLNGDCAASCERVLLRKASSRASCHRA